MGENTTFIARARTLLPELAEQVQWMREELLSLAEAQPAWKGTWMYEQIRRIAAGHPSEESHD